MQIIFDVEIWWASMECRAFSIMPTFNGNPDPRMLTRMVRVELFRRELLTNAFPGGVSVRIVFNVIYFILLYSLFGGIFCIVSCLWLQKAA